MKSTANDFYRESDNVYFNVAITHPDAKYNDNPVANPIGITQNTQPIDANYNISNDTPFLDNSSEYYASVIRFDIPLDSVPIFICPIVPNQLFDPDLTPMIIGINLNGTFKPFNVYFTPYLNTASVPIQNQPTQVITPYYYIYSYTSFIDMVNISLATAWVQSGYNITNDPTPYFFLDEVSGLIQLVLPKQFFNPNAPKIFMNEALINYLGAFPIIFNGYNQPYGADYYFKISEFLRPNHSYLPLPTLADPSIKWGKYSQEYSTLALWSSVRKILLSSAKLPLVAETVGLGDANSTRTPILTDFVPILNSAGDSRDVAYYIPSAQYRLTDMNGNGPLQAFDLKVYWQDSKNNVYPLQISLFQQINIKIAFLRKNLYKNTPNI